MSGCLLHSLPLLLIAVFQTGTEVKKNKSIYIQYICFSVEGMNGGCDRYLLHKGQLGADCYSL